MSIDTDKRLRSPSQTLVAARILQAWRWALAEAVEDLGSLDLQSDEGRELWLARSRTYSPADVVAPFPPMRFGEMTWGDFDDALRSLRKSARYVVRRKEAPGKATGRTAPRWR
jgi:hypothetical protein